MAGNIFDICKTKVNKIANIKDADKTSAVNAIECLKQIYNTCLPYAIGVKVAPNLAEEFTKALVNHKSNPNVGKLSRKLQYSKLLEENSIKDTKPSISNLDPDTMTGIVTKRIEERRRNIENKDKKHSRNNK